MPYIPSMSTSMSKCPDVYRCFVDFPRDRVPVVLAPLLYPETLDLPVSKLGIDSTTLSFSVCIMGYL